MCTEWPGLVLDYWGGKCSEPQSATEHATSTSRQNWVQIQYLNPNRLKRVARASGLTYTYSQYDADNYDVTQLSNTTTSYR